MDRKGNKDNPTIQIKMLLIPVGGGGGVEREREREKETDFYLCLLYSLVSSQHLE